MSDYPMLISNKLHSFRNFLMQNSLENYMPCSRIITRKEATFLLK